MELLSVATHPGGAHVEDKPGIVSGQGVVFQERTTIADEHLKAGMWLHHTHDRSGIAERGHRVVSIGGSRIGPVLMPEKAAVLGIDRGMPGWILPAVGTGGHIAVVDPGGTWLSGHRGRTRRGTRTKIHRIICFTPNRRRASCSPARLLQYTELAS